MNAYVGFRCQCVLTNSEQLTRIAAVTHCRIRDRMRSEPRLSDARDEVHVRSIGNTSLRWLAPVGTQFRVRDCVA
jgi:hypothetical protein